jgi:hypothetical protein
LADDNKVGIRASEEEEPGGFGGGHQLYGSTAFSLNRVQSARPGRSARRAPGRFARPP